MARTPVLLLLLIFPTAVFGQGKLDQVREAVDRPGPPSGPAARDPDCASTNSTTATSDSPPPPPPNPLLYVGPGADLAGQNAEGLLFLSVLAAPWMVPHLLADPGVDVESLFGPYPYARADGSCVVFGTPTKDGSRYLDRLETQWWSVRAAAEAGSNFDGLDRVGLSLFLDTDTRFGLKAQWDWYTERLPCGCRDQLGLGDVTATYRFVQNEWLTMHTGLGGWFLLDAGRDRGGFNFLYGMDVFPVKPVHLFGSFDGGTLGNASLIRLRGGVGVNWTHAELFAGYDFVRIGGVNLQGPMVGLRVWF